MENKYKYLLDKNEKLMKQLTGKFSVEAEKNIIWDMLITNAGKLRPYLNYILDKENVIQAARQRFKIVKETLNKNPIDTPNNTLSFLNGVSEYDLKEMGIKDIILVMTWERKVV